MANAGETGSFINGKAQAIEIIQALDPAERSKIIQLIKARDPGLASELAHQSFSFKSIKNLNSHDLIRVSNFLDARIFGISLKGVSIDDQREILSKLERDYAEIAYGALISPQASDERNIKRAQDKVLGVLSRLYKNKQISI